MCYYMPDEIKEEKTRLMEQMENDPVDGDMNPHDYCMKHGSDAYRAYVLEVLAEDDA